MAKEYIEREALLKSDNWQSLESDFDKARAHIIILGRPAADVVEVRHGEWLDNGDRDSNGVPKPFAISCSVCGSSAGTDWMNYCPNCGAKMDGERKCEDG